MKYLRFFLPLFILFCVQLFPQTWGQAHTFFLPRPVSSQLLLVGSNPPVASCDKDGSQSCLEHTVFYQESYKGDNTRPYFFGGEKTELRFDQDSKGDINPRWVHTFAKDGDPLTSVMSIAPQRVSKGVVLSLTQNLSSLHKGAWVRMVVPFVHATHRLGITESMTGTVDESSSFKTITQALNFENWRFGKWSEKSLTLKGMDDLLVQAGVDVSSYGLQKYYAELSVPLGNKPTGGYLFEPITGAGGHAGLGFGIDSSIPLFKTSQISFSLRNKMQYRYLFSQKQKRTFDLKGQPFSRYLLYLDTFLGVNTNYFYYGGNGVNFFTRDVLVHPGATGQSVNALVCTYKNHEFSLGYGFWWRNSESVSFTGSRQREFAVPAKGIPDLGRQWLPSPLVKEPWFALHKGTEVAQNDAGVVLATAAADAVQESDLDVQSGSVPFSASQSFSCSYRGRFVWQESVVCSLRLGGSYEMAYNAASMNSLSVWATLGLHF